MKFTEFGFSDKILKALKTLGLEDATEVQEKSMPLILAGESLVVRSQTGSGKTFAFALPLLQNTTLDILFPETLIICPTRELTLQVCDEIKKITGFMEGVKVVPVYGGSNITRQIQALKRKPQIVVGTPGRILDHLERKTLKLHYLKNVVLDEADEMLNMGFKEDIEKILKTSPENRRTLLFSATYPERIKDIVKDYMPEHTRIEIGSENKSLKNISQKYVLVNKKDKTAALLDIVKDIKESHILIFCNTKAMTERLATELKNNDFQAHSLHGDLRQSQRKIVTTDFKFKKVNILVASDVAARGLDINDIDFVINYDLPSNLEYFLHRMGRTARAGKNGNAITIVTSKAQLKELQNFEKQTTSSIKELKVSGFVYEPESEKTKDKNPSRQKRQAKRSDARKSGKDKVRTSFKQEFGKKEFSNKDKQSNRFEKKSEKPAKRFERSEKKSDKSERRSKFNKTDKKFNGSNKASRNSGKRFEKADKNFKNKAAKAAASFDVSPKDYDKVKRKKEMLTGKKVEESSSFKNSDKRFDKKSDKSTGRSKFNKTDKGSRKNTEKTGKKGFKVKKY